MERLSEKYSDGEIFRCSESDSLNICQSEYLKKIFTLDKLLAQKFVSI